jgi:hypothetical protein
MTGHSTQDDVAQDTNTFYRRTLHVLSDARVPFLVGGSHAFLHYTGIVRNTKDFDLFLRRSDLDDALRALSEAGYRAEVVFPHWLGKAVFGDDFVDLVFSSGTGVAVVDDEWFEHAVEADVLGMPVKLVPVEELIWQKAFIMERERYDGADITHLLLNCSDKMDWNRLGRRFEKYWQLLLSHLVLFTFVYPGETARLPRELMSSLLERYGRWLLERKPGDDQICQGTLLSRAQYLIDIGKWGYRDARLTPLGNMSGEEIAYWTWAIDNVK